MSPRHGRRVLLVFLLALALRVFVVLWLNLAPKDWQPGMAIFAADALTYDALAKNLSDGAGYQIDGNFQEYTRIPPLFPVLLAGVYALCGPSIMAVGLVNALLGALTAVVLYYLVRLCFASQENPEDGERTAFIAACFFAVYPLEIFNTPYVLKENFSIFLTVGFAYAWASMLCASIDGVGRSLCGAILTGILLGFSVLSRFTHVGLLVFFLLGNCWWIWKRGVARNSIMRGSITATICFLLVLSPWLARNYNLFGQLVLSSHGPARYLYNANSDVAMPEYNGYFEGRGGQQRENSRVDRATPNNPLAQEKRYAGSAARSMLSRPGHLLLLLTGKLVSMWRPVWEGSSPRSWLVLGGPYILLMALALPGLVLSRRHYRDETTTQMVLFLLMTYYVIGHLVFWGMIRERQYVEPYLMAFAAYCFGVITWRRSAV